MIVVTIGVAIGGGVVVIITNNNAIIIAIAVTIANAHGNIGTDIAVINGMASLLPMLLPMVGSSF